VIDHLGEHLGDDIVARIAVLIPCYNEQTAIEDTVAGYRKALPAAAIYVRSLPA
jgi:hypothetical protein